MAADFVFYPAAAGGCRLSLPAAGDCRHRRCRQCRPLIRKESYGFGDFGNFNLWFPKSSPEPAAASGTGPCPAGGSKCVQAQPAGRGTATVDLVFPDHTAFGEIHTFCQYVMRIKVLSGRAREGPFLERPPLERLPSLGCVTFQGDLVKVVCRERKVWYNVT